MASISSHPPLSPEIHGLLARVRARIRRYVWADGLSLALLWLGVAFWGSLAFDWLFEPPPAVRIALLAAVGGILGYVLYRYLFRRAFVPLSDASMAIALERRFGHFHDSLLTSVELDEQPAHAAQFNAKMLMNTRRLAESAAQSARPTDVFRWGPLGQRLAAAGVLLASIVAFAVFVPEAFAIWVDRSVGMSDQHWPRRTHLMVEGFDDENPAVKVGKGGEFTLKVMAELPSESHPDRLVPDSVQVRYFAEDGNRGKENMTREGEAVASRNRYQNFKYSFQNVMAPIRFYAQGGDDRTREYEIQVVENPTIEDMQLSCEYPDYFHKFSEQGVRVSGVMQRPQGSKLTLHARCNKELVEVAIDRLDGQKLVRLAPLKMTGGAANRKAFDYIIDKFDADQTLLFTLHDTDGIHTREPYRLTLTAKPDEPPQVTLRLRGIGMAITPKARLPWQGEITDDVGLSKIWIDYQIGGLDAATKRFVPVTAAEQQFQHELKGLDGQDYQKIGFTARRRETLIGVDAAEPPQPELPKFKDFIKEHVKPGDKPDIPKLWRHFRAPEEALDASELPLKVGQTLVVGVKAEDYCNLQGQPNVGLGERYELAVVTEQQLRSILEARELKLRRQFETIISDATDTHDSLVRIHLDKSAEPSPATDKKGAEPEDTAAPKKTAPGAEPGDTDAKPVSPATIRLLRVQRAIANGQRSAHETNSLALDFDDIREELVNNRLDTTEGIRTRLQDKIILPLQAISQTSFPELEKRLRDFEKKINDPRTGAVALESCKDQADRILREMDAVLKNMIELEDYNQVVENLRQIVELQARINDQTLQRQIEELKKDNGK